MRLRNSKTTGQERPQTPPTPGTPQSEDSVAPWVKDEVSTEKGPRFLEDIVADEVTYPLCRILWQFVLSPLWWMLRPTIWGNAYIFARGYRPDTDEFSERSETEFGQIPFQDKYTWCWLLQWIAWFMWGR
ncbi:hypothetical protein NXS19_000331 [Fusarium pseudograminearum]|nr:hypothetical protein NXS19_000331 [Fusarium pseudograminearum]